MEKNKMIDLHTHSYCSDGTFSPEGLVLLAKKQGLYAIALTDHDTLDGLEQFLLAGKNHGIETIPGIELAARCHSFHQPELHIVGLGFDPKAPIWIDQMKIIQQNRRTRNIKMAAQLTQIGLPITIEEVFQNGGGEIITRAHFANVLLKKGYVYTRDDAFSKYLSQGRPGYVPRILPTPKECIETIHLAGGISILAHPTLYQLAQDQLDALCQKLVPLGLDGIECFYSTYTPAQRKNMMKLAKKHSLFPSGGSDFHGENKPFISLGTGKGNLAIPYSLWENMKAHLNEIKGSID
ncbi:error-prone DNA polymerase [Anaerotignum neopropionicum]|uniref:Error-prone DNA polymerase n=1 Tax=Anaerotignum neopropionicum TaxID=36847 RepID=A0A136WDR8_9FIRM|nr:PHP domain-containing protein [Anaerotignum neopropionicum]KXL52650.1 error-prone DNA polymerase [Anaerotignum neopropionicum]